jgi:hypothetical protein
MIEKINYNHNKNINLGSGYINGQACGNVAKVKYGLYPMSYNGCEIIAVYNLMYHLGMRQELADIAKEIYPYASVLCGLFGSRTLKLERFFKEHKLVHTTVRNEEEMFELFKKSDCAVIGLWNRANNPFKGIHTIFVKNIKGKARVFNRSNSNPSPRDYGSIEDFMKGQRLIVAYCFGDNADE